MKNNILVKWNINVNLHLKAWLCIWIWLYWVAFSLSYNFRCSCLTGSKRYSEVSSHFSSSDFSRSLPPLFKLRLKQECKVCFLKRQWSKRSTQEARVDKVKPSASRQNIWDLFKVPLQRNCAQSQIVRAVKWVTIEGYNNTKYIIHACTIFFLYFSHTF